MVRGGVGVFKRDAVVGDVVVAVGEAAEVGLGVAETDAVGVDGEGTGGVLDDLGEVGDGRGEVLDVVGVDLGAGGTGVEAGVEGGELGGDGVRGVGLDGDLLVGRQRRGGVG